ncbi:hypothetical protein BJ980_000073 [Nocardioides daedukensis]|uniref:DUF732 domain-containing protein n=1 Tax=Nocardioides daedukensis TaxID=634462 RepID=A0A7Y9UVH0_9ACTN|nr:hypothetical protein [Nocardioides daedukensis]NYG57150.1 hypothetical protein [Nocardioides daedukensis]
MNARIPALLLAVTIGFAGLTACGSDDGDKSDEGTKTSQAPETTETETEPAETEAAEPEEADDAAGKPSREDVVAGYSKIVTEGSEQSGVDMPDDIVNKVVTCFIDEVYDDASAQTLQALADSNAAGIDPNDASLFTEAQTTCTKAAMG